MPTTDPIALDHQLQDLRDRQAISELIARLGRMLDDKRFDDAPSILADDVSVQTGEDPRAAGMPLSSRRAAPTR